MHRLAAVFILVVALHSPVWAQSDFHIISQVADGVLADGTFYKTTFVILPWFDTASPTCNIRFYGIQVHLGSETANSFAVNLSVGGSYDIQQTLAEQDLDTGYATVACDDDVFVQAFYSYYSADGAKLAEGTVKLTDLWTYSAPWTLHKLLILRSSADRFRLQTPRIVLNLTVPI